MASYAESLLTEDERVLTRERQHWSALVLDSWLAIILWAITVVAIVVNILLPDEILSYDLFGSGTWFSTAATSLVLVTFLLGVIVVLLRYWWWRTQEFLVTNRRLVLAYGVLNKSASDSSLEKINDAQLEISLLGRFLDYGSLKVLTAAPLQGSDYLDRLSHAKSFKKTMMSAKHDLQISGASDGEGYMDAAQTAAAQAPAVPVAPPAQTGHPATTGSIDVSRGADPLKADTPEEVAAVLERLTRLRDDGHITTDDYETKKQELLERL
jgi:hypothetical protein